MTPDLSIVIVSFNTRDALVRCLGSVADGSGREVWVVDNHSGDGSPEEVRTRFPDVHLIANDGNRGFAAACNQALRRVRGDVVVLLNSDAVPDAGALRLLASVLHERPDIGVVGGRLLSPDGRPQRSYGAWPTVGSFVAEMLGMTRTPGLRRMVPAVATAPRRRERPRAVGYVSGACLAFRRELLETVGLLDERFFLYFEETDFCVRVARDAGLRVWFEPSARIRHDGQASAAQLGPEAEALYARSAYAFVGKHHGARAARRLSVAFRVWIGAQCVMHRLGAVTGRPQARAAVDRKRLLLRLHRELGHPSGWGWAA